MHEAFDLQRRREQIRNGQDRDRACTGKDRCGYSCSRDGYFTIVFGEGSNTAEIFALVFTIGATILASIQKICDYENQAQGNTKAADMYLRISKRINLVLNFIKDNALTENEILEKAEEIQAEISHANELGSQFPTSRRDYKRAQEGIKNGEENYTNEELNLWE